MPTGGSDGSRYVERSSTLPASKIVISASAPTRRRPFCRIAGTRASSRCAGISVILRIACIRDNDCLLRRGDACCAPTPHALVVPDGRNPQNDADAGAAARGPRAGDAAEGTPAGRRRRRYHDLRSSNGDRPLDLPGTVARARWHSTRDRERGVSRRERTGGRGRRAGHGDTSTTMTEARSYGTTKPVILTT